MRWLLRVIGLLLLRAAGLSALPPGHDVRARADAERDERERADEALREGGGHRTVQRHRFGVPASVDGVGWGEERTVYLDGLTQTVVEETVVRRCDCGVLLSYGNRAKGVCNLCGRVVCGDCHAFCQRCGALCCRRCSRRLGEQTMCSRHGWLLYWAAFWRGVG